MGWSKKKAIGVGIIAVLGMGAVGGLVGDYTLGSHVTVDVVGGDQRDIGGETFVHLDYNNSPHNGHDIVKVDMVKTGQWEQSNESPFGGTIDSTEFHGYMDEGELFWFNVYIQNGKYLGDDSVKSEYSLLPPSGQLDVERVVRDDALDYAKWYTVDPTLTSDDIQVDISHHPSRAIDRDVANDIRLSDDWVSIKETVFPWGAMIGIGSGAAGGAAFTAAASRRGNKSLQSVTGEPAQTT